MTSIKFVTAALALELAACGSPPATDNTAAMNVVTSAGAVESSASPATVPGPGAPPAPAAPAAATPQPAATAWTQDRYLGRWTGVEGTYLEVATRPGGGVTMTMQYDLDHKQTADGSVTAEGLRFMRDGKALIAVPSTGDATGLKWLAGKKDCLTVQPGEGYCRT